MKKLFLFGILMVLCIGFAYAAPTCTFDQAASSSSDPTTYVRGSTQNLSATISSAGSPSTSNNITTAVISAGATGCSISGTLVFNTTAGTNNTYVNTTVDTYNMKDETSCTFTMTLKNETQASIATCTQTYIADNTVPAFSSASPAANTEQNTNAVDFSITCSNSSSTTLYIDADNSYTMVESSDTCTYSITDLNNGEYNWYVIGSDGLNSTTSSTTALSIRSASQLGGAMPPSTKTIGKTTSNIKVDFAGIIQSIIDFIKSIFNR